MSPIGGQGLSRVEAFAREELLLRAVAVSVGCLGWMREFDPA